MKWILLLSCVATAVAGAAESDVSALAARGATQDRAATAKCLTEMGVWVLTPPKSLTPIPGAGFDLKACQGVSYVQAGSPQGEVAAARLAARLSAASGIPIGAKTPDDGAPSIRLAVLPTGEPCPSLPDITREDLADLGLEGYALHVDATGISLAARDWPGLFHGMTTLTQAATDRNTLPGMHIRDWPALRYRGVQQDISRGQVPFMDTFRRLVDVLGEAHLNILELYIEHTFKFESHPDISPPEGISPEEGRALFDYASERHIEVHPLFQVLGHSYHILNKPQYHHLRIGPCEEKPWIMTFDIRKPEAVAFVNELVDELCETFPGRLFNVDITEIDCDGMLEKGMTLEDVTDLVYGYVLQLNAMVKRHDMRLMIAQGPLDSTGHLAGMGPKLDVLPKDVIIGSYYCAGGPYSPAWEKDYPRLQEKGFDFFAQAWIGSHVRLMPPAQHALDFSDAEVSRGLAHGAIGSITTDWGDAGNYHLTGQTWYPFVYHGACAWTGANLDRDYFNQAFTRLFYGVSDDSVARAIHLAGNISQGTFKTRGEDGKVTDNGSYHFWEFFGDPFTRKELTVLADPAFDGQRILEPASEAVDLLERAQAAATRNQDNLDQLLFGARSYEALGRKLIALSHYNDPDYPREEAAAELDALAATYEALKEEFRRLWLAEDRENDNFHSLRGRFDQTIVPCRQKAAELRKAAG